MHTNALPQKEAPQTAVALQHPEKSTQNPLQLQQPTNNPLQFTRKQAEDEGYTIPDDKEQLKNYLESNEGTPLEKLRMIYINNHDLDKKHKDYIDLDVAKGMIYDYDEDSLQEAANEYLDWVEDLPPQIPLNPAEQENAPPANDTTHIDALQTPKKYIEEEGILPPLTLGDRNITLIGAVHLKNHDYSPYITDSTLQNAHLVLEYPPLTNTGQEQYTPDDMNKVQDDTQKSLAVRANKIGSKIIGAEGRKAFDKQQKLHTITLRHKLEYQYKITDKPITDDEIRKFATNYVKSALGLADIDMQATIAPIEALVLYEYEKINKTGIENNYKTNSNLVLKKTYTRVRELSKTLPDDRKKAIDSKVMTALNQDLTDHISKNDSDQQGISGQSKLPPGQKDLYTEQTAQEFNKKKITYLHDAICNLLLFTEVLACDKNMVVAFGGHHITPLNELIKEVANPKESTTK